VGNRFGAWGVEGWLVCGQRREVGEVLAEEAVDGAEARGGASAVGSTQGQEHHSTATLGCTRMIAHGA
jgi:hypothetical protein